MAPSHSFLSLSIPLKYQSFESNLTLAEKSKTDLKRYDCLLGKHTPVFMALCVHGGALPKQFQALTKKKGLPGIG